MPYHNDGYEIQGRFLNQAGYHLYILDHQGTGHSEGDRKYIERFDHFLTDFHDWVQFVRRRHTDISTIPNFVIGHSLGGLIAARLAQRYPTLFDGIVLKAPALHIDPSAAPLWQRAVAAKLSKWLPRFSLPGTDLKEFTHNMRLKKFVDQDPLNSAQIPNTARFGAEVLAAMDAVFQKVGNLCRPMLILHGDQDELTLLSGSELFVAEATKQTKSEHAPTLKVFRGLRHDFFHEEDFCEEVKKDILTFFDCIVGARVR